MARELDGLADELAPLLTPFGYRRSGWSFVKSAPDGSAAAGIELEFLGRVSLPVHLTYVWSGLVTPATLDYAGVTEPLEVAAVHARYNSIVLPPLVPTDRWYPPGLVDGTTGDPRWFVPKADEQEVRDCAADMMTRLQATVLPRLERMLDVHGFLAEIETRREDINLEIAGPRWWMCGLWLAMDFGTPDQVRDFLDEALPDRVKANFWPWVNSRRKRGVGVQPA